VVGVIEGDEALRVPGGLEDPGRVLDADEPVGWGVADEEGTTQLTERLLHALRL